MSIPSTPVAQEGYQEVDYVPSTPKLGVKRVYLLGRRKSIFKPIHGTTVSKTVSLSVIKQPYMKYLLDFNLCKENFESLQDFSIPLPETITELMELIHSIDYLQDEVCLAYLLKAVAEAEPDIDEILQLPEKLKFEIFLNFSPNFICENYEKLKKFLPKIISLKFRLNFSEILEISETRDYNNSMIYKPFSSSVVCENFQKKPFSNFEDYLKFSEKFDEEKIFSLFCELSMMSLISNFDAPLSAAPFTNAASYNTTKMLSSLDLVHSQIIENDLKKGRKKLEEFLKFLKHFGKNCEKIIFCHKNPDQVANLFYYAMMHSEYLEKLTSIDLSKNSLEFPQIYKICDCMIESNIRIKTLNLAQNDIRSDALLCLISTLAELKIEELGLSHNPIRAIGAQMLSDAFRDGFSVKKLNLSYCAIGDTGARALAEALEDNQTVEELSISVNNITDFGFKFFLNFFKKNFFLKKFEIFNKNLNPRSVESLQTVLADNKSLKYLGIAVENCSDSFKEWHKENFLHDERELEKAELYSIDDVTSQYWFLISESFLTAWRHYVNQQGPKPDSINNFDLVDENGTPRRNLISGIHYRSLAPAVWMKLHKKYRGGPCIVRGDLDIYSSPIIYPFSGKENQDLAVDSSTLQQHIEETLPEPTDDFYVSSSPLILQTK